MIIRALKPCSLLVGALLLAISAPTAFGNGPPYSSPIEARKLLAKVDADQDRRISLAEWRMQSLPKANFKKLDRNRNGFITFRELAAFPPSTLDATRDGKLSARELKFGKAAARIGAAPASK